MAPYLIPRSKSVTLDGSGNGQVTFEIDNTNQRWLLDAIQVETTQGVTQIPIPRADVYVNSITPNGHRGGTSSGNNDQATGRAIIYAGDTLYVVWSAGVPGTVASATIDGTYDGAGSKIED